MKGKINYFKIFIVLLVSLFTLSFFNTKTIKAVDTRSVVVGNDVEVNAPSTGTFSYPIKIIEGTDISSLQFSLFYDLSNFHYEGYDDLGNDLIVNDENPGKIILNFSKVDLSKRLQPGSSIITLHFRINNTLNQGSYNLLTVDPEYMHKFGELTEDYQLIDIPNYSFDYSKVVLNKLGDLDFDGYITVFDATKIQMHLAGLSSLDAVQLSVADVNFDGYVNIIDATILRLVAAGLRTIDGNLEKVTVRFFDYYGNMYFDAEIDKGSSINPPDPYTPDGYVFMGWDNDLTNINESMDFYPIFDQEQLLRVNQILGMPVNSEVLLEGYVYYVVQSSLNDIMGFYLQDYDGKSIYVYHSSTMDQIHVGDYIKLKGTYTLYFTQPEIININIITHINDSNYPYYYRHEISIQEIYNMDPNHLYYYGNLYTVFGTIILENDKFYMEDAEGYRIQLRFGSTYTDNNDVISEDFLHYVGQTGYYTVILADFHSTDEIWRVYTIANSFEYFDAFTVTFYDGFGEVAHRQIIENGNALFDLPVFSVDDLTLVGWYLEPDLVNQYIEGTPITEDINLYPKLIKTDEVERSIKEIIGFPAESLVKLNGVIVTFTYNPNSQLVNGMYVRDAAGDLIYIYGNVDYSALGVGDFVRLRGKFSIYFNKPEIIEFEITEHIEDHEVLDFSSVDVMLLADIYEWDRWDLTNAGQLVRILGTVVESEGKYYLADDSLNASIELNYGSEYTTVDSGVGEDFLNHIGDRGYYTLVLSDFHDQNYNWRAYLIPNTFEYSYDEYYGVEFRVLGDYDFGYDGYMKYRLNELSDGVYGELNMFFDEMSMEMRYFKHSSDGTFTYYPSTGYVEVNTEDSIQVDFGGFLLYAAQNMDSSEAFDYFGEIVSLDKYKGYYSGIIEGENVSLSVNINYFSYVEVLIDGLITEPERLEFISKFEGQVVSPDGSKLILTFSEDGNSINIEGYTLTRDIYYTDPNGDLYYTSIEEALNYYKETVSISGIVIDIYGSYAIIDDFTSRVLVDLGENTVQVGDIIHVIGNINFESNEALMVSDLLYFEIIDSEVISPEEWSFMDFIELNNIFYNPDMGSVPLVKFYSYIIYKDESYFIQVPDSYGFRLIEIRNSADFDLTGYENEYYEIICHLAGFTYYKKGIALAKEINEYEIDSTRLEVSDVDFNGEYIVWNPEYNHVAYYIFFNGVKYFTQNSDYYVRYLPEGHYDFQIQAVYNEGVGPKSTVYTLEKESTIYDSGEIYSIGKELLIDRINNSSVSGLYKFKGTIVEIQNYEYGNMYIEDEYGGVLYIYGLYNLDGQKFEYIENPPVVGEEIIIEGTVNYFDGLQLKNAKLIKISNRTYNEEMQLYVEIGYFEGPMEERVWVPTNDYLDYPMFYSQEQDAYLLENLHVTGRYGIKFIIDMNGETTKFPENNSALRLNQNEYLINVYYSYKNIHDEIDLRAFFSDYSHPFKAVLSETNNMYNDIALKYEEAMVNETNQDKLIEIELAFDTAKDQYLQNLNDIETLKDIYQNFVNTVNEILFEEGYYLETGRFVLVDDVLEWQGNSDFFNYRFEYDNELDIYKLLNIHTFNSSTVRVVIVDEGGLRYFPEGKSFKFSGEENKFNLFIGNPGEGNYFMSLSDFWGQYELDLYVALTVPQEVFNILHSKYAAAIYDLTDQNIKDYLKNELNFFVGAIDGLLNDEEAMRNLPNEYQQIIDNMLITK